jgi:hypothetical protein
MFAAVAPSARAAEPDLNDLTEACVIAVPFDFGLLIKCGNHNYQGFLAPSRGGYDGFLFCQRELGACTDAILTRLEGEIDWQAVGANSPLSCKRSKANVMACSLR